MPRAAITVLLAGAAVAASVLPASVAADAATTLPDVEDEVMCPVCGTPLNQAQAPQADRQRALIRQLVARGLTKEQIKRRLVQEYGPEVLAMPPARGFHIAAYGVPIAAGLAGLVAALMALRRWRRRPAVGVTQAPTLSPAERRRLDEDLARSEV